METAKYKITGLVDIFDEQNNITGQYPIGSVQELTIERGTKAVADGAAEAVGAEEPATAAPSTDEKEEGAPESGSLDEDEDEDSDDGATGATGEEAVE